MKIYGVWALGSMHGPGPTLPKLFLRLDAAKRFAKQLADRRIDREPRGMAPFDPEVLVAKSPLPPNLYEFHAIDYVYCVREHELQCSPLDLLASQSE